MISTLLVELSGSYPTTYLPVPFLELLSPGDLKHKGQRQCIWWAVPEGPGVSLPRC